MRKLLATLTVLMFCTVRVFAQQPGESPGSAVLQSCLLGTTADVWRTLELTRDQQERMHRVQEACKEECDVVQARKRPDGISPTDGSTVMAEVRNILSAEQYRRWVMYCGTLAMPEK